MTDTKTLPEALAAFQAELPRLVRDETASVKGTAKNSGKEYDRSYSYADLAQVCETVLPVLGKHGLSITATTTFEDSRFVLQVTLMHESGDERNGYWPLPDPMRVGPQDLGSAMTYGRRYLTLALTGTFPGGEDDDGAKAQSQARDRWENAHQRPAAAPVSAAPAPARPKIEWTDEKVAEYQKRISESPLDLAVKGYDWLANEGVHNRAIPMPTDDGDVMVTATETLAFRLADLAVLPEATLSDIAVIRASAEDRGLLNTKVSDSTTLVEELDMARDTAAEQAAQTVKDAKADHQAAEASALGD